MAARWNLMRQVGVVFATLATHGVAAQAEEALPLQSFGASHPECVSWTDQCQICQRTDKGDAACSTSGIACVPKEPVCVRPDVALKPIIKPAEDPHDIPASGSPY